MIKRDAEHRSVSLHLHFLDSSPTDRNQLAERRLNRLFPRNLVLFEGVENAGSLSETDFEVTVVIPFPSFAGRVSLACLSFS